MLNSNLIVSFQVNFSLLKRFNGYKPFLYNITVDACKALRHSKYNPIFSFFYGLFKHHSNMNHTCPFDVSVLIRRLIEQLNTFLFKFQHDLIVEKLPTNFLNQKVNGDIKFPHGDYLFHSDWYAYGINRATVDFFLTLSWIPNPGTFNKLCEEVYS